MRGVVLRISVRRGEKVAKGRGRFLFRSTHLGVQGKNGSRNCLIFQTFQAGFEVQN